MSQLFVLPKQVLLSSAGGLLPGAKAYFYATGTTTAQAVYQDIGLTTPHTNPVVADAAGVMPAIYMGQFATDYRVRLETSAGVLVYQLDNIPADAAYAELGASNTFTASGNGNPAILISGEVPNIAFSESDQVADSRRWQVGVNAGVLAVAATNDQANSFANAILITRGAGVSIASVNLLGTAVQANGVDLATGETGSFTGTLSDMASATTGTVKYSVFGGHATLYVDSNIFGTSNATSMQLSGLPAAVLPASSRICTCETTDSGGLVASNGTVSGSGVTFGKLSGSAYSASGYTSSGSKGLPAGWQIIYKL